MNQVRIIEIKGINTISALNLFWHNDCLLIRRGTNAHNLGGALTEDSAPNSFVHLIRGPENVSVVTEIEVAFGVEELMQEVAQ